MSETDEILSLVQKPSRYIGGEVNSIEKDRGKCSLSFALAFPDAYEVGMSHLGLQILYTILNNQNNIAAERAYAPWPDMEFQMRKRGIPLTSMESGTPLNEFDIVGFSLQYELSYTNVLNMLELGGISIHAEARGDDAPIIIAGGPSAFNPDPTVPFIDAFAIGEGEEVILEISRAIMEGKKKNYGRKGLLSSLADIEGVYVPSIHGKEKIIVKRTVADLNESCLPLKPVVPLMKTIHDRVTLEIARGCTRGCRFCQAGMVWRPARERNPETLKVMAEEMLSSTGYDELSLLSLSSGDYSQIEPLLSSLMDKYYERRIALALPSLRVETLTEKLIEEIKRVRKTSFTLAPEAGTQRMRNVINKGNTEEDLVKTARRVFDAGWRSIKLYFMIGLPTERQEDLEGIVDLAYKVLREGNNKRQVTVSLSTFIPKPHTPFQWQRQISLDETMERQEFFKKNVRHKNLKLKWHDRKMSLLEGLLSRGDERTGALVERVFSRGCRFDGWSDHFRFNLWEEAMKDLKINVDDYLRKRGFIKSLPWDNIDCGITRDFLMAEERKSESGGLTEDCRFDKCYNCGACRGNLKIILADKAETLKVKPERKKAAGEAAKFRIRFAKEGTARLLSHLEASTAIIRAINISGLNFCFSEGFHPHPKISFPFATSVGIESRDEYADIQVRRPEEDIDYYAVKINSFLPSGLEIMEIEEVPLESDSLSLFISGYEYEIYLSEEFDDILLSEINKKIDSFLKLDTFVITRERKGKYRERDIRHFVSAMSLDRGRSKIDVSIRFNSEGSVKPTEILKEVMEFDDDTAKMARIIKRKTIFSKESVFNAKRNNS
ncbi:MAG: TIGR03960 family B12-binding radical SAM protein [Thermodesulfobacteriota bacterium]|nr:TIGR03960 family B12-binding radical SAM protein [Thermodesulfobacteriota bacterium]